MNSTAQLALDPQAHLPTGPTHVASRSARAPRTPSEVESNSAFLAAAGRVEFGRYEATLERIWMAFAYFASLSDGRTCYATVEHIAEKARRSGRTVRRHVPSLMARGLVECGGRKGGRDPSTWSVVLPADVRGITSFSPSVLGGQDVRAGRTECPGRADTVSDDIRDREKVQESTNSSCAREVCKICGNNWPAEYGTTCYQCPQPTASQRRRRAQEKRNEEAAAEFERELLGGTPTDDKPKADVPACTCGDAYRQSYGRLCVECKGEPSAAQRDALREKDGGGGANNRGVDHGGGADNPSVPETETRQPPGPNQVRFRAELVKWTVGKRTGLQHGSDRRRTARTARHELADLAKGEQADDRQPDTR